MITSRKLPKLTLKSRNPDKSPTGSNMEASLDGVPLKYLKSIKIEVNARSMVVATLEMIVDPDVETTAIPVILKRKKK